MRVLWSGWSWSTSAGPWERTEGRGVSSKAPLAGKAEPDSGGAQGGPRPLLLDACCAINFFATRRAAEIVSELPYAFAVVDVAQREAGEVRRGGGSEDADEREAVDWQALIDASAVKVLTVAGEAELGTYVELAASLDDGEAATCAVAMRRGYAVATDDRKARNVLTAKSPQTRLYSTLDLLKQWCERRQLAAPAIQAVLRDLRERGRFLPPRGDPLKEWWDQFFSP